MEPRRSIVTAFRGIRYRTSGCSDLSALIAPPYDVISEEMQAELYARHPHNFVRVELPRNPGGEGRYQSAAQTLAKWRENGVMASEKAPAVYVLEQEFRAGGEVLRRRGVLSLVRLPEEGRRYILSHEGTLAAARADRLELMRACQAMTSPVMVIHEDPEGELLGRLGADRGAPQAEAEEHDGVRDRLWVVSDDEAVSAIAEAVGGGPLAIADGHHRFETAMAYRREMRARRQEAPPEAEFNYALMLITSGQDPALAILPTHRVLSGLGEAGVAEMKARMQSAFHVSEMPLREENLRAGAWDDCLPSDRPAFAVYLGGGTYYVLAARDNVLAEAPSVVERLAVSIIHRYLIDPAIEASGNGRCEIRYVTGARQALEAVRQGTSDAAVLLRPTRVGDVLAAARAGRKMPGKSTYFYPKVPAGWVLSGATAAPVL